MTSLALKPLFILTGAWIFLALVIGGLAGAVGGEEGTVADIGWIVQMLFVIAALATVVLAVRAVIRGRRSAA